MLHEVCFDSYNKRDKVYGWVYAPAAPPVGIIQLVHGFGEHSRRYLHMIVFSPTKSTVSTVQASTLPLPASESNDKIK